MIKGRARWRSTFALSAVGMLLVVACNGSATPAPTAVPATAGTATAAPATAAPATAVPATAVPVTAAPVTAAPATPEVTAAPPSAASQPFAGQTINVTTFTATPEFDFYKTLLPEFTAQTGINVDYVQLPVSAMDQKIPLQLTAKDSSLDVFNIGSENIGKYVGLSAIEPLDSYIADTAQTPAAWNFSDIAPAVESACQQAGKTYCIATHTGGGLLYYNTKMFAAAGITAPPQNPDELLADAKLLTKADGSQYGFCVRGDKSQALYDAFQLWQWFVPYNNPITGTYFDKDWNFLIGTEPQASAFGSYYRELLTTTAPKGIATYLVSNCIEDFEQGRVAMWHDDSGSIPDVLDLTKSKVSSDTAFWSLPCQTVNPSNCTLVQPFGIWMNAASEHKGAAWQFMQWETSKDVQSKAAIGKALLTPSRNSVIQDPTVVAALPKTFPEALSHILANPDTALLPFIPEGVAIIPPIADGLSELITSSDDVATVMARMKQGVDDIMTAAGYPKPFPSN